MVWDEYPQHIEQHHGYPFINKKIDTYFLFTWDIYQRQQGIFRDLLSSEEREYDWLLVELDDK